MPIRPNTTNSMQIAHDQLDATVQKALVHKKHSSRNKWNVYRPDVPERISIIAAHERRRHHGILAIAIGCSLMTIALVILTTLKLTTAVWVSGVTGVILLALWTALSLRALPRKAQLTKDLAVIDTRLIEEARVLFANDKGEARIGVDPTTGDVVIALWAMPGEPDGTPAFSWEIDALPKDALPFAEFVEEGEEPLRTGPSLYK